MCACVRPKGRTERESEYKIYTNGHLVMLWISIIYLFCCCAIFLTPDGMFRSLNISIISTTRKNRTKTKQYLLPFPFPYFLPFPRVFSFRRIFFCCCYLFYHSHVRISSPLSRIKVSFHAYTYTDTCIQIEWIFFFESWKSVFSLLNCCWNIDLGGFNTFIEYLQQQQQQ